MKPSPKLIAIARWLILGTAVVGTVLAGFIVVENWRGNRAWAVEERELKAKGEKIDFSALLPPFVPDAENLFKAPMLAHILYQPVDAEGKEILQQSQLMEFFEFDGVFNDFPARRDRLQKAGRLNFAYTDVPAADVLNAMQPLQSLLDELRAAARRRPLAAIARNPVPFQEPSLNPNVAFQLGLALSIRAMAEVELHRPGEAEDDIFALQRFADGLFANPIQIGEVLIGEALRTRASKVVSQGCRRHLWNEAQLVAFQKQFGEVAVLAAFKKAEVALRVESNALVDVRSASIFLPDGIWPRWLFHGWAQQNKVAYSRRLENLMTAFTDERIFPDRLARLKTKFGGRSKTDSVYELVSIMTFQNVEKMLGEIGKIADRRRLDAFSWVIERYRLIHGRYPETLQELVPAFINDIPRGVFDGQPFHYGKLADGKRQLYSDGINGRDDGGKEDDIAITLPDSN